MKRWQFLTTLCLLALWLPALNHCRLELLPGFDFLACCAHEDTAPHEDNDCETDGCALIENGFFKLEEAPVRPVAPDVLTACPIPCPAPLVAPVSGAIASRTDPQISCRPWQFVLRAVGPPRAPSLPA